MASFNKVVLLGNLARDVEVRYLQSGNAVANGCIVVNDRRKQGDDWIEEPTFVDLTLWGRTAEVAAEYTKKGSQVLVEGRLKSESWEDKEGNKRSKMGVVVEKLQLCGSKSKSDNADTKVDNVSDVPPSENNQVPF